MTELSIDVFVSVDGFASGSRSPGYFGCAGPASYDYRPAGPPPYSS